MGGHKCIDQGLKVKGLQGRWYKTLGSGGACGEMESTFLKGTAATGLQQQVLCRNAGPVLPEFLIFQEKPESRFFKI